MPNPSDDQRLRDAAPALLAACKANWEFMTGIHNRFDDILDLAEKCRRLTETAIALAEPEPQPQVLPPLPHDRIDFFNITGEELGQ